jgi:hypothetical protein
MPRGAHLPKPKKGERTPGSGRKPGTPNKITRTVKEIVAKAVADAQADPKHPANVANFSKTHPREFWQVASKLIPEEIKAAITGQVRYDVGVVLAAMAAKDEEAGK